MKITDPAYVDHYWTAEDGLKLHCRDYGGASDKAPLLCLPGLNRNAREFEHLSPLITAQRRMIAINLRGRGGSEHAREASNYNLEQDLHDLGKLFDEMKLDKFVMFASSTGAVTLMQLASSQADRFAGALINDLGPVMEVAGVERLLDECGQGKSYSTWVHAARDLATLMRDAYPDYALDHWIGLAKRIYRLKGNGRIKPDYDLKLVEAFRAFGEERNKAAPSLWAGIDALADVPTLILRGEHSEMLSEATAKAMQQRMNACDLVTVPRVGHPPALNEAEALDAIESLLGRCD